MKQFEISKIKPKLSFKTQDSTLPYISKIIDYGYDIDFDVFLESKGCNLRSVSKESQRTLVVG